MLEVRKRHRKACQYAEYDQARTRCRCSYWAIGTGARGFLRQSLKTSDYEEAVRLARRLEAVPNAGAQAPAGTPSGAPAAPPRTTLEAACSAFEDDLAARKLSESTRRKYRTLALQLQSYAAGHRIRYLDQLLIDGLTEFRTSWRDGARSGAKKLERLKSFFRFALEHGWIDKDPSAPLRPPIVRPVQVYPFDADEMARIYRACIAYPDTAWRNGVGQGRQDQKVYAFVLLLRYTGFRISDAAFLSAERLDGNRVFLYARKTGEPVYTLLPQFVADRLRALPAGRGRYFFIGPASDRLETVTDIWRRKLARVFELAGPFERPPHPHRFRHTFAVAALLKGVSLEDVSILLGHSTVKITERYYGAWVPGRQKRLEDVLAATWADEEFLQ